MTTTTLTYTPWGWTHDIEELTEGVLRVSTPSHGGLKLSRERWNELPAAVRDTMLNQTFAEEDCEEPIVRTLLGLGDAPRERACAHGGGLLRPLLPSAALPSRLSTGPPLPRHSFLRRPQHGPLWAVRRPH